jgi:hypothetical protein
LSAAPLLRYRLRWYAVSTARLLLRRWQGATLAAGLLGAAGTSLFGNVDMLTHPMRAVLAPGHGASWRFAYLLALQAVCALWAGMQRAQIEGGAFMAFSGSLPFSLRQRRRVDLAVLLADSPLLLLAGAALAVTAVHRAPPAHLFLLCDVVLLALTNQVAVLERRHDMAAASAAARCRSARRRS